MVEATVAMVVVTKALLWDAPTANMAAIVGGVAICVMSDAEAVVGCIILGIVLKLPISWKVAASSGAALNWCKDTLILGIRSGIGVNVKAFAITMSALKFSAPTPFEGFSRWAAFDCRLVAALDCDRVLQACMPSCHVC